MQKLLLYTLQRLSRGYRRIVLFTGRVILAFLFAACISGAISLLLWWTATTFPRAFTITTLSLATALLVFAVLRSKGLTTLLSRLLKTLWGVLTAAVFVIAFVLLASGNLAVGLPTLAVAAIATGFVAGSTRA